MSAISVNEQISEKSVVLIIVGGKMTAKKLARAMVAFLRLGKKIGKNLTTPKDMSGKGKQTVKQLVRQGMGVNSIKITDNNIKAFESVARKYGIDFALRKDISEVPPKWLVFFKAKDADALTAAFKEYSAKQLKRTAEKPSVLKMLRDMMEKVKAQVIDKTKYKEKEWDL